VEFSLDVLPDAQLRGVVDPLRHEALVERAMQLLEHESMIDMKVSGDVLCKWGFVTQGP